MSEATRNTGNGEYFDNKTSHGPEFLGKLDPELVRGAAPNRQRLFDAGPRAPGVGKSQAMGPRHLSRYL